MKEKINRVYLTAPYITFDASLQTHFVQFEVVDDTTKRLKDLIDILNKFDVGEPIDLYLKQKEGID